MTQLVKYKKGKFLFEIATKPESVKLYRSNKIGWDNVLAVDTIFVNSKKGDVAKSSDLIAVFGKDDVDHCAKIIAKEGEIQVSATERKQEYEEYKNKVIGLIHRTYVDANNMPYPRTRIESVIEEAKVQLDPRAEHNIQKQIDEIIKKMHGKMVFRKSTLLDYKLFLKHCYAKKCIPIIKKYVITCPQEWNEEGCIFSINISPTDLQSLTVDLNKLTAGDYAMTSN